MSSIALIVIQETRGGISIDQIPLQNGTPLEREISKAMDVSLKAAQEFVMMKLSQAGVSEATEIEGSNIEQFVSGKLKDMGAVNFRKLLVDAGYKIP